MKVEKIFEDESILVVNKPSGMVVNRAETTRHMVTLEDWLEDEKYGINIDRHGVVHRLDKETSGALVIAKSQRTMNGLQSQFKDRLVSKTYLALVHGKLSPSEGVIKAPISRNPFNRKRFGVFVGGRESESRYEVKEKLERQNDQFSLVEVKPKTGRTHQIRVHMKHLNHAVVGDTLYAGRKTARNDRQWCPRLFLHAYKLKLNHPVSGLKIEFKAKLPKDLETVLKNLRKD